MGERYSGKDPQLKRGVYGTNRRGLIGYAAGRTGLEQQRTQSYLDKQKLIEKFRRPAEERVLEPRPIDLGNKELAAYKTKKIFQDSVRENEVTISVGPTGSGKSTQGIQFLIESGYTHTYALVPRQIIADNLGERLREELAEHFGKEVAIGMVDIIHGDRSEISPDSVATVMTPETFIKKQKEIREKHGDDEIIIFNDEVHEAALHTEIALAVSAIAVQDNPGWKLVLASATIDEAFVQATYKDLNEGKEVPVVRIESRPHQIATSERPDINAMEAYLEIGEDHEKLMIFTSGEKEIDHIIEETATLLEARKKGSSQNVVFRKLIGTLTARARKAVFNDPVPDGSRLVVVSSPVGMSGLTFPGNTGVIVDGTVNRPRLNQYGIEGLERQPATQAEITQMFGRAARDVEGGVAMLVKPTNVVDDALRARGIDVEAPEFEFVPFEERDEYPPVEIYNVNLSRTALEVAGMGLRLPDLDPHLMHKIEMTSVLNAETNLRHLGALKGNEITNLGRMMDKYPLSPELSRGLVEASQPGRTVLHMARAALIATAIDSGGLQDFSNKNLPLWDELVRPTSNDDFMTQHDIMTSLLGKKDLEKTAYIYNLQPRRVEQVMKTTEKVFKILGIRSSNIVFTPPKPEEEDLLRDDFTPGMLDLVYESSIKRGKVQQYLHVLGNEGSTHREISDRSTASDVSHEYIAGFPRWYTDRNRQVHEIIDRTLIVKPETVARYASKMPDMLDADPLSPRFDGGRVVELEQFRFGSIIVGEPVPSKRDIVPEDSRKLLEERVLQRPGIAQLALREIADELAWFEMAIPKSELDKYRAAHAPDPITHESIRELVYEKSELTRDMHVIDELLAAHIYSKNISIQKYFDQEALDELRTRSPSTVTIGKSVVDVHYENGQPYITKVGVTQRQAPLSDYYLPDGREILLQIARSQRLGGTVRLSPKGLVAE